MSIKKEGDIDTYLIFFINIKNQLKMIVETKANRTLNNKVLNRLPRSDEIVI